MDRERGIERKLYIIAAPEVIVFLPKVGKNVRAFTTLSSTIPLVIAEHLPTSGKYCQTVRMLNFMKTYDQLAIYQQVDVGHQ